MDRTNKRRTVPLNAAYGALGCGAFSRGSPNDFPRGSPRIFEPTGSDTGADGGMIWKVVIKK